MKTKLCLTKNEARSIANLNAGDPLVLVRVMGIQPPKEPSMTKPDRKVIWRLNNANRKGRTEFNCEFKPYYGGTTLVEWWSTPCPYKPGRLGLAEARKKSMTSQYSYIYLYKADYPINGTKIKNIKWCSSDTPDDAIRSWFDVTEVGCKRVQELNILELYPKMFPNDVWVDYKGGESISVYQMTGRFKSHWNTIHANPWVEVLTGKVLKGVKHGTECT